jgi:hypothetical protein
MFLPNRTKRSCVVTNISNKTVDVIGFRLRPGLTVDLFDVLPNTPEWKVIEAISPPNGDLYIESEQKGTITIDSTDFRTYDQLPVYRNYTISLENFRKGAVSPANGTFGSSPAAAGLVFANITEKVNLTLYLPENYVSGPVELDINYVLLNNETEGNLVEWVCDYVVVNESHTGSGHSHGDNVNKTSSQVLAQTPISNGTADLAGTFYRTAISFDPDDTNNPFSAGSIGAQHGHTFIFLELGRASVGGAGKAGSVLLTFANVEYLSTNLTQATSHHVI